MLLIKVVTLYQEGQNVPPAEVIFTVIPLITAPAGSPVKVYVAVGFELSMPEIVTVPEDTDAALDVALEEPEIIEVWLGHNVTSAPALAVGAVTPVPEAATLSVVAPELVREMFPL